jgi:ParB family chromosome partitioning protein
MARAAAITHPIPRKRTRLDGRTREVPIGDVIVGARIRKDLGDIAELADSIGRHGLIHPIAILADGTLVAGHRRLEACKRLKWTNIPARVVDLQNPLAAEIDENEIRLDFSPLEIETIRRLIEQRDGDALRLRQRNGLRRGAEPVGTSCPDGIADVPPVAERTAAITGVSPMQVKKIKAVAAAAQADPATFGPIAEEMDRTRKVDRAYRTVKKKAAKKKSSTATTQATPESVILNAPETAEDSTTQNMRTVVAKYLAAIEDVTMWAVEIEHRLDEVAKDDTRRIFEATVEGARALTDLESKIRKTVPEACRKAAAFEVAR